MKFPTLLGLALLITAISLGGILYYYRQKTPILKTYSSPPKNIQVVNIEDTNITLVWETDIPSIGQIAFSKNSDLSQIQNDNRDHAEIKEHLTHFVTLENLTPDTKYYYKVKSGSTLFPDNLLDFKTAKTLDESPPSSFTNNPIRGTVLNQNLNPIDEGLVFLKIKDAQDIATFISTAGNFIVPLSALRNADLSSYYKITDQVDTTLLIRKNSLESQVNLSLPLKTTSLPTFTLGQNINLNDLKENPIQTQDQITPQPTPIASKKPAAFDKKFDLNGDGKINSLDLSIIADLYNRNQYDKKADINGDQVIDSHDIEELSKFLQL